jgi:hypothetical protein
VIVGFDACAFALGLVIAGMVVLFALRVFVDWKSWQPRGWWDWVAQELERAGRVPLPLLAVGMTVTLGGVLFLAIDGC